MPNNKSRVPVTILTGYLGAGKTTILNHLLTQDDGRETAVIINEFGEISIDAQLVIGVEEDILEINNGCICCTVRADLVSTIQAILQRPKRVERILIETTGLADPAAIIQSFVLDETLRIATELDAVVTVVDARHNALWLAMGDEDAADGRENTAREQIAFADLVLINKIDLIDMAEFEACRTEIRRINLLARIDSVRHGKAVWADVMDQRRFDLRNALRLEPELLSALTHEHAEDIGSIVVRPTGALDPDAFFRWLNRLLQAKGRDILRVKGIVEIAGERRRYVFHGVHMTLDGQPGRPWGADERRAGEIVFIGRRLGEAGIRSGVEACVAEPALA